MKFRGLGWLLFAGAVLTVPSSICEDWAGVEWGATGVAGGFAVEGEAIHVTGSGADLAGKADEGFYAFQPTPVMGDFDYQVRVQAVSQADVWTKAGIMARVSTNAGAAHVSALTTPSISGSLMTYREGEGGVAVVKGFAPVNHPYTWLRLQRQGDLFTAATSYDGREWFQLGSISSVQTNQLLLGLVVCSHTNGILATATFKDWGMAQGTILPSVRLTREAPGPSSRRGGMALTEIMWHPAARSDGKDLAFVELLNTQLHPEDISGWRLSGDLDYVFPAGTVVRPGEYCVVARRPEDLKAVTGLDKVLGGFTNLWQGNSGTVRLRNRAGAVLLEASFGTGNSRPKAADGAGHSQVLAFPSLGEGNPAAWQASSLVGGSPGALDPVVPDSRSGVCLNELLANPGGGQEEFLELYNRSPGNALLEGCILTDNLRSNKFVFPKGTVLEAGSHLALKSAQLGFHLSSEGESVYLFTPDRGRVLDAVQYPAQAAGVPFGRAPDGSSTLRALQAATLGAPNSPARLGSVVISEIMYHPISNDGDDEFLELYNRGSETVDIGGWRFTEGIDYAFPAGTKLGAGEYLVVARNASRMLTNYPGLSASRVFGDLGGSLSDKGEHLELSRPEWVVRQAGQTVTSNLIYATECEVRYRDGGQWPELADGGGSSLELMDLHADPTQPSNWAASDETTKGEWTTIEHTGVLDWGNSAYPADSLQVFLLGAGECLVDDVEVIGDGGTNRIVNPSFDSGLASWYLQGNCKTSTREEGTGVDGTACLHLRCEGRGDTGANRVRATLKPSLLEGSTATLRARVRWLQGHPEILLRLHGNYLEATGPLRIARNLGTPGQANSRAVGNRGPAIYEVVHSPVLPAANEVVRVTARACDPDGLAQVMLKYRIDPDTNTITSLAMRDDGKEGDLLAGDGVYSALLPAMPVSTLVAFTVEAVDAAGIPATNSFPANSPASECLVRYGDPYPMGSIGAYRMWMTKATQNRWTSREKLSNAPLPVVFVYGQSRVIYGAASLYAGSPFISPGYSGPTGALCGYVVHLPSDDPFLGVTELTFDYPARDGTLQLEQVACWMARELDIPYNYRRPILLYVNGAKRGSMYEDAQQPNSDLVEEWFPDDQDGDLYKIDDWFEFDSSASGFNNRDASLENFTTTNGEKKLARYRWNWRKRAVQGSANDYRSLFELVDAVSMGGSEDYTRAVESVVDVEEWMRVLAIEHVVGNWDSFGYQRGKNMFAYKPTHGKWVLMTWDIDFVMSASGDSAESYLFWSWEPATSRMLYHPPFQRAYYRALKDLVDGPMQATVFNAAIDDRHGGMLASGLRPSSPAAAKTYAKNRRNYMLQELASVAANFTVSGTSGGITQGDNLLSLSGTAPVEARRIRINGREYPLTWDSVTGWRTQVTLEAVTNRLEVVAYDSQDRPLPGQSVSFSVTVTNVVEPPEGNIVFSEVMYLAPVPGTEYVELHNRSLTTTYDLSGWRLEGVDFTFPEGATLRPEGNLVVAAEAVAFLAAHPGLPYSAFAGAFAGRLSAEGEFLRLVRPGRAGGADTEVARVYYPAQAPWLQAANGGGASLQVLDTEADPNLPANWTAVPAGTVQVPEWKQVTLFGSATSSRLSFYLSGAGDVYLDDVRLEPINQPTLPPDMMRDGGFEEAMGTYWQAAGTHSQSQFTAEVRHGGRQSLHLVSTGAGQEVSGAVWEYTRSLQVGWPYLLSFWFKPGSGNLVLNAKFASGSFQVGTSTVFQPEPVARATPGQPNSAYASMEALPRLWLNEIKLGSPNGLRDNAGAADTWVELAAVSTNHPALGQCYLSDSLANLMRWRLPMDAATPIPSFPLVWLDGQPAQSTADEWHADFGVLTAPATLFLSCELSNRIAILDYLRLDTDSGAASLGYLPDAQLGPRRLLQTPTPGAPNGSSLEVDHVVINEWMAANAHSVVDPFDGDFEDWFELYNPSSEPMALGGYTLSDSTNLPPSFTIPDGYTLPAGGYHVVWADREVEQYQPPNGDLHVNFRLGQGGDSIVLRAPDGRIIDAVSFGPQTDDVSQGRWPNGAEGWVFFDRPTPGSANRHEPPVDEVRIAAGLINNLGQFALVIQSEPGKRYRIQAADDLAAPNWLYVSDALTAAETTLTWTAEVSPASAQRFYRVERQP